MSETPKLAQDTSPPQKPEIIPPRGNSVLSDPEVRRKFKGIGFAVSVPFCFWLVLWCVQTFFEFRPVVHMVASRIVLAVLCLGCSLFSWTIIEAVSSFRVVEAKTKWRLRLASVVVSLAVVVFLDWWAPRPLITNIPNSGLHERPAGWRAISDWQKAELVPVLEQYPNCTLHIIASGVSDETWDYANQFRDFFVAHKWKVIGPETSPPDQILLNMQLSISEQYWGKERPEAFTALDSALKFIHIKNTPNFVVDPLVRPDEVVMWIGPETPPGYPQHIPLQLGTICRNPLSFRDDPLHFIGSPDEPARFVRIFPSRSRFLKGDEVLVLLTGYASEVGNDPAFTVQSLGKVMPRPDALDVSIVKDMKAGEPLFMKVISKTEIRVRCVQDRSPEPSAINSAPAESASSPKPTTPIKDPIHWSQQDVASDANEWPNEKLLTIQTDETIESPNFRILCDAPCAFGKLDMGTNAVYGTNRQADERTVEAGIRQSFTPRTPLSIVLYGHSSFAVKRVQRVY